MSLIFLKLGGSAITDKTREATAKPDVIRDAARAVKSERAQNPSFQLLLGHGSGSFGHFAAKKWGFGERTNWRAYAETGAAAQRLNRLVTDILLEEGIPVVSIQPSASAHMHDGELDELAVSSVQTALEHNLIPLVYGDVAFDETRGMSIASTDALFAYLAPILKPSRIIYATAVKGIYTADPLKYPDAKLIPEITPESFQEIRAQVGEAHGVDVTGGMMDKLARSIALVQKIPSLDIHIIAIEMLERAWGDNNFQTGTWVRGKRQADGKSG